MVEETMRILELEYAIKPKLGMIKLLVTFINK
jgi:hypothetical protein